ncbi:MAG: hypothetical protein E7675_02375 [Ruminococcaceae bacterium]|nr:hypothetical protein [Oscillospiraceae bacterium]
MIEKKFTREQTEAIETKGKNVLVSAAAGSGKTTVLCERIKNSIIQGEYTLDEIIVVSFNTESARDIKEKLLKNLSKAYDESGSISLFRQIAAIDRAQISTIHSFALKLIKENAERLGLPAKTRNMDESEESILKNTVMDRIIAESYSSDSGFVELSDVLTNDRDGDFSIIFLKLYDKLMNEPEGIELILHRAEGMEELTFEDFKESKWGKVLLEKRSAELEYYRDFLGDMADSYVYPSKAYDVYGIRFRLMANIANGLLNTKNEREFREYLENAEIPNFKGARGADLKGDDYDYYKGIFDEFSKKLKGKKIIPEYDEESFDEDISRTVRYARITYGVLKRFEEAYQEEKRRKGLIDYTDMERMAHKLLIDENGERTEIAKRYARTFKAVFVDEYQDTNRVQDEIFGAISDNNLFIVGDIKQSIYGFRGACPDIFSEYRKKGFKNGEGAKIFLSDNFRSDEMVVRFSNAIFSGLMPRVESIGYRDEDNLKHSKVVPEGVTPKREKVEIHLFANKKSYVDENGIEIEKRYSDEAGYVASRIKSEIESGRYKPSDIAILVRGANEKVSQLIDALGDYNIPISTNEKEDYYKKPHVLMLMCLLNFIDNPKRDIYTAGALRSEIFRFNTDELVHLKLNYGHGKKLWEAIEAFLDDTEGCGDSELYEKAQKAKEFFEEYRILERNNSLEDTVRRIIDSSGIVQIYTSGKSAAEASAIRGDIYKIHSDAKSCSARYGMGMSGFVAYIEKLAKMGKGEKTAHGDEESVRLMTIHGSKGLEFKLCFLYNIDKAMKTDTDEIGNYKKSPYEYEATLGVALPIFDSDGKMLKESSVYRSITANRKRTIVEEEMRLFYVALTRAEEKLILTGKCTEKRVDSARMRPENKPLSKHEVFDAGSFLEWILLRIAKIPTDVYDLYFESERKLPEEFAASSAEKKAGENEQSFERLSVLEGEYKYKDLLGIPAKLTVSKLTPEILDGEEGEELTVSDYDFELPSFMEDGKKKATGAEVGTATHLFMQFCSFDGVLKNGVEGELERLVKGGFIQQSTADLVSIKGVEGFFASELFSEMKGAERIYREQRFNIKLPAVEFTKNNERKSALEGEHIFVQGVIDCVFESKKEGIVLVDYKTDSFSKSAEEEYIENTLKEKYRGQLTYYKKAVGRMFGKEPARVLIYSFALGRAIEIGE